MEEFGVSGLVLLGQIELRLVEFQLGHTRAERGDLVLQLIGGRLRQILPGTNLGKLRVNRRQGLSQVGLRILELCLNLFDRKAKRLRIELHQHLAGADEVVLADGDALDAGSDPRPDIGDVSRHVGVVRPDVPEVILQPGDDEIQHHAQQNQAGNKRNEPPPPRSGMLGRGGSGALLCVHCIAGGLPMCILRTVKDPVRRFVLSRRAPTNHNILLPEKEKPEVGCAGGKI